MINQLLPGVLIASAAEAKISTACFNHCTPAVPGRSLRLLLQFIVISVNHTLPYHETGCVNSHFSFPSSFSHVSPENSYKQESSAAGWGRQDDAGVVKWVKERTAVAFLPAVLLLFLSNSRGEEDLMLFVNFFALCRRYVVKDPGNYIMLLQRCRQICSGNLFPHCNGRLRLTFYGVLDKGRPLPKFCEWDVNDTSSAEGFTVIFNKVRNEKKTGGSKPDSPAKNESQYKHRTVLGKPQSKKWFCCVAANTEP
ncbi:hypothetical protein Q3G72_026799 [Acer saccharum]|nr:hypothetical protein Q3G72_026799 [Acer saccharum]